METLSHVSTKCGSRRSRALVEKAKLVLVKKEGELLKQKVEIEKK